MDKKILGQIDIFLDEFSDIKAPEIVSQLRKIKREIGDSTHHIDVNKKWKGGAREYLMGIVDEKQGNVQKALKNAVNEIDKIIEDHQKDDDIESGNISGSPLTVEDIRKVKVELKKYAKTLSNFYEGLSSVDLTNGIEQGRFSEDYKNYSRDLAETLNIKELMDAVSIAVELTGDKRPSGYTAAEWQEIYGDLAGLKERIDLTLEKYIAELVELFGDKEEGLYKYFLQIEKDRLDDYNQKYGQRSKLRNIATAIEAANTAVRLYEKGNIDVRERWEDAAAVLKEIDSIIGQWLDNKHKVRSSLSILKRSIEEWYNGLSDDVREKWLSTIRQEMRDIQLPGLTNIQEDISKYDPVKSILIVIDEYVKKLDEGKINSRADLNAFINERVMVYMLSAIDFHLKRYQSMVGIEELRGIEGLRKEDADKLNIVLDVFKDEMMNVVGYNYVSSSVAFSPLIEFKILLGNAREVIKGIVDSGSMLSGMFYYLEKNGELIDRELLLGLVVGFEKQIVGLRNNLKENRRLEQDKQKYYEAKIKQIIKDCDNLISVLKEIVAKQASSAMISPVGGIDFTGRAMRLKIERVGSFADLKLVLPAVKNAQDIDLDKEFRQIEAIASSGLVPNSRRILELFSACYARGSLAGDCLR